MTISVQSLTNAPDPFDPMAGTMQGMGRIVYSPDYVADSFPPLEQSVERGAVEMFQPERLAEMASLTESSSSGVAVNISILALDLGHKTGYALRRRDGAIVHGTEDFTPRASWQPGQKWQRFRSWLSALIVENHVTQISFEDVKRHGPGQVLAAHAYGGFRAMLEMVADQHRVTLHAVGVGQIKKHWTGNGVAKKPEMIAQAKVRGFHVVDDNNADALAILHLAVARERGEWKEAVPRPKPKKKRASTAQGAFV